MIAAESPDNILEKPEFLRGFRGASASCRAAPRRFAPADTLPLAGYLGSCKQEIREKTMDAAALRSLQAPIKERYKSDPKAALITLKANGSIENAGIACKV